MLTLECLGAKHGDCIVLHFKTGARKSMVLFDGGPSGVYKKYLKPWLDKTRKELAATPKFTLGMVSHIDDDHINGILALMRDISKARKAGKEAPAEFDRFWFNSFSGLTAGGAMAANTAAVTASMDQPNFKPDTFKDARTENIIASVKQGHDLSNVLGELGLGGNAPLNALVTGTRKITVAPGLVFHLLAPLQERIDELRNKWDKEIPVANIAAFADKSVPNLSSIVVMVEAGGKKVLMTGDARGDDILEALEEGGYKIDGSLKLDVLKVPHHGSDRNVTKEFFEAIPASTYIISADGTHHNPDDAMIDMLISARGQARYEIVLASRLKTKKLHNNLVKQLTGLQQGRKFTFSFRDEDALSVTVEV